MANQQPNYFRDYRGNDGDTVLAGATMKLIDERWIGMPGECYALGVGVQDPNLWAVTTFKVLINGVPSMDYGSIRARIGSIDLMTPVTIYLPPYARIEVYVTNGGGTDSIFMARLECRTT